MAYEPPDARPARPSARLPATCPVPPAAPPRTAANLMRVGPRDFEVIRALGDGSFGTVFLANWKSPLPDDMVPSTMLTTRASEFKGKRLVAIKRMKKPYADWHDCLRLRELRSLLEIPRHPHIVALYDAFLMPGTSQLHFVFESLEGNLFQLTKVRKGRVFAAGLIASIFRQTLQGLAHVHAHGFFHRDMKPENLLLTTLGLVDYPDPTRPGKLEKDVSVVVKIADFGLARELTSRPPYSTYVSTRWYRAPEMLLRASNYSAPVDLWALGAIMAEVVNLEPLFPGATEAAQLQLISETLGSPSDEWGLDAKTGKPVGGGPWPDAQLLMERDGVAWPHTPPVQFSTLFGTKIPTSLVALIQELLRYNPSARPTAAECLQFPYMVEDAVKLQHLSSALVGQRASASAPPPAAAGSTSPAASSALRSAATSTSVPYAPPSVNAFLTAAPSATPSAASIGVLPDMAVRAEHLNLADASHLPGTTVHASAHGSRGATPHHGLQFHLDALSTHAASRAHLRPGRYVPHRSQPSPLAEEMGEEGEHHVRKGKGQGRARALLTRRDVGLRTLDVAHDAPSVLPSATVHHGDNSLQATVDQSVHPRTYLDPRTGSYLSQADDLTWTTHPVEELATGFDSTTGDDGFTLGPSSPPLSCASASSVGANNVAVSAQRAPRGHVQHWSYGPERPPRHNRVRGASLASVQTGQSDPFPAHGSSQTIGASGLGVAPPPVNGLPDQFSAAASAQRLRVRPAREGTATSNGSFSSFEHGSVHSQYSHFSALSNPLSVPPPVAPRRLRRPTGTATSHSSVDSELLNDLSNMLGTNVHNSPALNPRPLRNASRASDGGRRSQHGRGRSRGVSLSSKSGLPSSSPLGQRLHPYRSTSRPLTNPSTAAPVPGQAPPVSGPKVFPSPPAQVATGQVTSGLVAGGAHPPWPLYSSNPPAGMGRMVSPDYTSLCVLSSPGDTTDTTAFRALPSPQTSPAPDHGQRRGSSQSSGQYISPATLPFAPPDWDIGALGLDDTETKDHSFFPPTSVPFHAPHLPTQIPSHHPIPSGRDAPSDYYPQ